MSLCLEVSRKTTDVPEHFVAQRHTQPLDGSHLEHDYQYFGRAADKERQYTLGVALIACLRFGIDPPDAVRSNHCARLQCWVDPQLLPAEQSLQAVGDRLQQQYEQWATKANYRKALDPNPDEVMKTCKSLRRAAGPSRVLFHYNGHGVPRPTRNGELWVFNRGYSQYVPISLFDIQSWLDENAPSLYVFDCSHAGQLVKAFNAFMVRRRELSVTHSELQDSLNPVLNRSVSRSRLPDSNSHSPDSSEPHKDSKGGQADGPSGSVNCLHILLAACGPDQTLPSAPHLPADLFTSCLTTPVKVCMCTV
jgi:regulator-associated protein of mTOR